MIKRRNTKTVTVGSVKIGSRYPVSIQSMVKTAPVDVSATVKEIKALEKEGCEIVRVAVKSMDDARALGRIKAKIDIPLVADIHFNWRLALEALARGVDCLRLNPGNIYGDGEVGQIARAAKKRRVPIRVGVNAGSLRNIKRRMQNTKLENLMVSCAIDYIRMLEDFNFYNIIVSLKASDVNTTVNAYRRLAGLCRYPFHLGITASGLPREGTVKSAIGIGTLLLEGIGDTIRVSLTGSALEEVAVAKEILQALKLRHFNLDIIACPGCGRAEIDVVKIAGELEQKVRNVRFNLKLTRPMKVAIMGCEVNGPGEALDADIGIAGGKECAALFKNGRIIKRIKDSQIVDVILSSIRS